GSKKQPGHCTGDSTKKSSPQGRQKPKTKEILYKEGVEARREVKRLKQEVGQLEQQVGSLQKDYMALRKCQSNANMDDTEIRNGLLDIKRECQIWAREY